jgi:NitT/TauT family transport system ATP-binding protein
MNTEAQNATSLVSVESVTKVFIGPEGPVVALKKLNCDFPAGSFSSVIGPSGCGKTTLLRLLAKLISPTSGEIQTASKWMMRPGGIGFVFQQPQLLPWRSALKNVTLPLELLGYPMSHAKRKASELLALLSLEEYSYFLPRELSGGMKQRVSIARALITRPSLLLLDEPFTALDEMTRWSLNTWLLRSWREQNITVVFVTHSIAEAIFLADRVFVMTPCPGTLNGEVEVNLPRPRTHQMRTRKEFQNVYRTLLGLLGEEQLSG